MQLNMKYLLSFLFLLFTSITIAQSDATSDYKKRVLESTEIEFNAEGEKPLGYVSMTFLTNYYVKEKNRDVAL